MTKRKTTASAAPAESISFIHQINLSRSDTISQELATRITGMKITRPYFDGYAQKSAEEALIATGLFARSKLQVRKLGLITLDYTGFIARSTGRACYANMDFLKRVRILRDLYAFEVDWGDFLKNSFPRIAESEPRTRQGVK